jgi:hypothetical protein
MFSYPSLTVRNVTRPGNLSPQARLWACAILLPLTPGLCRRSAAAGWYSSMDERSLTSDESDPMTSPTHGMVHDDRRHFSYFTVTVEHAEIERLPGGSAGETAGSTTVHVLPNCNQSGQVIDTRRRLGRWVV